MKKLIFIFLSLFSFYTIGLHLGLTKDNFKKLIVNNQIDINSFDQNGDTYLHRAAYKGQLEVVELLIAKGANVNSINIYGIAPLHRAAHEGHLEIVKKLLESGAKINSQSNGMRTPLIWASEYGQTKTVEFLLFKGADINIGNNIGENALWWAATEGYLNIVKILLANGTNIDTYIYDCLDEDDEEEKKIIDILRYFENLKKTYLEKNIELPFVLRRKNIELSVARNIQQELKVENYFSLNTDIMTLVFSFIKNEKEFLSFMFVSKHFYLIITQPNVIIRLIKFLSLDKNVSYLERNNKEIAPIVTWEEIEKL